MLYFFHGPKFLLTAWLAKLPRSMKKLMDSIFVYVIAPAAVYTAAPFEEMSQQWTVNIASYVRW